MSLNLNAIVTFDDKFKDNIDLNEISDACFGFISEACKRKLAINQINFRDEFCESLQANEMIFNISNSYIFCEAEKILLDDYSVKGQSHFERLKNLQDLIEYILYIPIVREVDIVMCDDGNNCFEEVNCSLNDFASVMKEKLFQKISFAYKCKFVKI